MQTFRIVFLCMFFSVSIHCFCQQVFQHESTSANSSANSTFVDAEGLTNNPSAIVTIQADASTATANPHPIGIWFNGSRWAVFNQNRASMPAGVRFTITWKNPDANAYWQKASGGRLLLDHPALNNNPEAVFSYTSVWNPAGVGGVYNNATLAAVYDAQLKRWEIKNSNGSPLPEGSACNIILSSNASTSIGSQNALNKKALLNTQTINDTKSIAGVIQTTDVSGVVASLRDANLDFENAFFNWRPTGNAFPAKAISGNPVLTDRVLAHMKYDAGGIGGDYWKGMVYPIGIKGNNWVSSFYENEAGTGAMGSLLSAPVRATDRYLTFLLSGGADFNKLYVELQVKKEDWEQAWSPGKRAPWGETTDGYIKVTRITPSFMSDEMFRYYFDLPTLLNNNYLQKTLRICLVDEKAGNWGYINVDDFVFKNSLQEFLSFMRNGNDVLADADKPVWGFADTHAHWINHVGLKNFMWGKPGGKLATSNVLTDIPPCDGFNHGLPTITPGLLFAQVESKAMDRFAERLADPGNAACAGLAVPCVPTALAGFLTGTTTGLLGSWSNGATAFSGFLDANITNLVYAMATCVPFQACGYQFAKDVFAKHYNNNLPADKPDVANYVDFPAWNSFAHQTMHISWVRRSYEGGQRLMVVPVGVAKSWEFNTTTDGVMRNSLEHIQDAVAALKELVRLNDDWLQIAYTAKEAREIILKNKMAIVIGLEQAETGSYFASETEEVNHLYNLGIRHFFPIHNINNTLGGAAVFNSDLNSYNDLVNRAHNHGAITPFSVMEGSGTGEKRVNVKLKRTFKRQEMRFIPIVGFGQIPFLYINDVPPEYHYEESIAHKNVYGLSARGKNYIRQLMLKGAIIDIDHMSDKAQDSVVAFLKRNQYPLLSSHTNFRDLRREASETSGDLKEARLKTEFTIYNSRANDILQSGGMFGIMNQQNNIRTAEGSPVKNTSAGGSSSFLQAYWYALQKGGFNQGIAFGSDANGFAPQVSPRFGTQAAYFLEGDDKLNTQWGERSQEKIRRTMAFQQKKGVKYDKPIRTYHYHRFQPTGFLTSEERDIWEALAMAKSGADLMQAWQPGGGVTTPERTLWQVNKIRNIANGFRWAQLRRPEGDFGNFLQCHDIADGLRGECPNERWAAYMCVHGENALPAHLKSARTTELYTTMKPIYDLWMQFENGPNEPMRRSVVGNRDFDFNLDGQAHYGMLPDLIQDIKNQGLSPQQLTPLFLGAEQFIRMWQKAEAAKASIRE